MSLYEHRQNVFELVSLALHWSVVHGVSKELYSIEDT